MLITCPTCASSYRIDAGKIGPEGRSVRCAACRETWFLTAADGVEDEPAADPAAGDLVSDPVADAAWAEAAAAIRETAEPQATLSNDPPPRKRSPPKKKPAPKRRPAGKGLPLSPAALALLALLAALPVACLARTKIVGAVPQTASLFSAIGLPVNRRGLEIRDVVAFHNPAAEDEPAELVIEGDLVGVDRADVAVPGLTVEISDAAGKPIRTFPAMAPRTILGAGESARFRARLADPPAKGRAVMVRFAAATRRF
jgi:predicted Zn finger-like uncharacterized protein